MGRDRIKNSVWTGVLLALLLNLSPTNALAARPKPKARSDAKKQRKTADRKSSSKSKKSSPRSRRASRKTGSTRRTARSVIAARPADLDPLLARTSDVAPVLADVTIPGASGVLVETLSGKPVIDSYSDYSFNPASNVKLATAYAVLKVFGPAFRFQTSVWTDGVVDEETGTLIGNLYVSGRDPMFNFAHAITVANELNRMGVRAVSGDLIVTDSFSLNQSNSPLASAVSLHSAMVASKRSAQAVKAWDTYLLYAGKLGQNPIPNVDFGGLPFSHALPSKLSLLFTHESVPLREILKVTLCYSSNSLAEKLGDMVGGPYAVANLVRQGVGVPAEEFSIQTSSGLGVNRVTPRAMMKLLRALRSDLERYQMTYADIMPVAGIDEGTLAGRFAVGLVRGSVVGKTGTLGNTDAGVSSLSGEISTAKGPVLFVIFNQRGSVPRFRNFQNFYISVIQGQFGGAVPMDYNSNGLESRLAGTRISYPERGGKAE